MISHCGPPVVPVVVVEPTTLIETAIASRIVSEVNSSIPSEARSGKLSEVGVVVAGKLFAEGKGNHAGVLDWDRPRTDSRVDSKEGYICLIPRKKTRMLDLYDEASQQESAVRWDQPKRTCRKKIS